MNKHFKRTNAELVIFSRRFIDHKIITNSNLKNQHRAGLSSITVVKTREKGTTYSLRLKSRIKRTIVWCAILTFFFFFRVGQKQLTDVECWMYYVTQGLEIFCVFLAFVNCYKKHLLITMRKPGFIMTRPKLHIYRGCFWQLSIIWTASSLY